MFGLRVSVVNARPLLSISFSCNDLLAISHSLSFLTLLLYHKTTTLSSGILRFFEKFFDFPVADSLTAPRFADMIPHPPPTVKQKFPRPLPNCSSICIRKCIVHDSPFKKKIIHTDYPFYIYKKICLLYCWSLTKVKLCDIIKSK